MSLPTSSCLSPEPTRGWRRSAAHAPWPIFPVRPSLSPPCLRAVRSSSSRPSPALSFLSLPLGPTVSSVFPAPSSSSRRNRHSTFPDHVSSPACAAPLLPSCSALPTPVAHLPTPPLGLVRQQQPPLPDNSSDELPLECPSSTPYKPLLDFSFLRPTPLPPPLSLSLGSPIVPAPSSLFSSTATNSDELSLPPRASPSLPRWHHHTPQAIAVLGRHSSRLECHRSIISAVDRALPSPFTVASHLRSPPSPKIG